MILTFFLFASAGYKFLFHLKETPGSKESTRLTGLFRPCRTSTQTFQRFFPLIRFRTCSPPGAGSKPFPDLFGMAELSGTAVSHHRRYPTATTSSGCCVHCLKLSHKQEPCKRSVLIPASAPCRAPLRFYPRLNRAAKSPASSSASTTFRKFAGCAMSPDATATKHNTGIQYTCKSYNIASNLRIIKLFFKKNHFFLKLLRFLNFFYQLSCLCWLLKGDQKLE